jgi:Tol biopolymer transport system component
VGGAVAVSGTRIAPANTRVHDVARSTVPLPVGAAFDAAGGLALSPDGTHVAYVVTRGDNSQLYLHALDEFDAKLIVGAEGAQYPFFSPDGRWLGFSDGGKLKKVAVSGGAPQTICDTPGVFGAAWGPDGTIVFSPSARDGLYRVAASGGVPQALTMLDPDKHEKSHRLPRFLPDGTSIVFTIVPYDIRSFDEARVAVMSLATRQIRVLFDGGGNPTFVSTGHLLYSRGSSILAVPFDPHRWEVTGQSAPVLDDVSSELDGGVMHFSVAESGLLTYVRGGVRGSDNRVVLVDSQGNVEPLMEARHAFRGVTISPDGRLLALEATGPNDQIWLYDLARGTLTQLTFAWDNIGTHWMHDSERIAFLSNRLGPYNFYWQGVNDSGPAERLTESPNRQGGGSWLPDGEGFAYVDTSTTTGWDIWLLTVTPERRARPLVQTPADEWSATFSPDGRWLAYVSDETGHPEVYVQSFPKIGAKWHISGDGGQRPLWDKRQGKELYYRRGRQIMAVAIQTQPTFVAGVPRLLFTRPFDDEQFDVTPDGRFIMIEPGPSGAPVTRISMVQNWFEELKRRVAMK